MFEKTDLLKLAQWTMPFGKYKGLNLIDLPDEYLLWFQKQGYPDGELGELLTLCKEIKLNGLEGLVRNLK